MYHFVFSTHKKTKRNPKIPSSFGESAVTQRGEHVCATLPLFRENDALPAR